MLTHPRPPDNAILTRIWGAKTLPCAQPEVLRAHPRHTLGIAPLTNDFWAN